MAKIYDNFTPDNLMSFGKSFSRINGQPLDKSSIWYDLKMAEAYAKTDAAYVGQILAVINREKSTVTHYRVNNAKGDLEDLGSLMIVDNKSVELNGKIISLKNFGKQYYRYIPPTQGGTEGRYELTPGFIDGLEVRVKENSLPDGKEYELVYYQHRPATTWRKF